MVYIMSNLEKSNRLHKLALTMIDIHQLVAPQMIQCLAVVYQAGEDGVSPTEIEKRTGLPKATASRIARRLSSHASAVKEGLGLAYWKNDPKDFRKKYLVLNREGKEAVERLLALL